MKNVSFPESRSRFRHFTRGIMILAAALPWGLSRTAHAGSYEYQAPYSIAPGTNGISAVTGTGPGMQLFRENAPVFNITPYYPPQQPVQSANWLPFAMVGLAMAPMLFSDSPAAHAPAKPAKVASNYQLVRGAPTGQTSRRGPAAIPLRTRYQPAQTQQNSSGAR